MKYCKAKKFDTRMSKSSDGKAEGERGVRKGVHGHSAGEMKMGISKMTKPLTAAASRHRP